MMRIFTFSSLILASNNANSAWASTSSFQSGPSGGSTYAGGMTMAQPILYVTGGTHDDGEDGNITCFLSTLSLPNLKLIQQWTYANAGNFPEACSAIASTDESSVVVGTTKEGGVFTDNTGTATQYGMMMELNHVDGALLGGSLMDETPVQYPTSVVRDGSHVFVASMTSHVTSLNIDGTIQEFPHWTSGGSRKYGSTYDMMIHRYSESNGWNKDWIRQFTNSYDTNADRPVYVGGMLVKGNHLLVVGTTSASGPAFGQNSGTAQDGFITKIDTETGNLSTEGFQHVLRINKENGNDMLTNICDDPNDSNAFYVVGAVKGKTGDLLPALMKIKLDTLTFLEEYIIHSSHPGGAVPAKAYSLACIADGDVVYIAGTVEDGAIVEDAQSYGSDDVFVAQVSSNDLSTIWLRQVGSSGKDRLAQGGGLVVSSSGDPILYGNTDGPLFRSKQDGDSHTDLFAFGLSKADGAHDSSLSDPVSSSSEIPCSSCIGIQLEGPSYAGAIAYLADHNAVYFTGATFKSDKCGYDASECFFRMFWLDDMSSTVTPISKTDVPEACSAMSMSSMSFQEAYLVLNPATGAISTGSTRIAFLPDKDDWVLKICTDPNDSNVFYIVGATTGSDVGTSHTGTIHPFVARMTLSPLGETEWHKQFEVKPSWGSSKPTDAQVYGCAVDGESSTVYIAGVVKDGASLVHSANDPQMSAGKNDLFVGNLESASGKVRWVKQLGSSKNERMGHGGGIVVDSSGNAILLGQTEGFMYPTPTDEGRKLDKACPTDEGRKLDKASDVNAVVLFSVDIDGNFQAPVVETDGPGSNSSGGDDKPTGNPPPPTTPTIPEIQAGLFVADLTSSWDKFMVPMCVVGPLILSICCLFFCRAFRRKNTQKDTQRKTMEIFKYLRHFHVDDVDIRRSPAGGYHGTYLNYLAVGSNKCDRNLVTEEKKSDALCPGLSDSSIDDDYLFMSKKNLSDEEEV